MSDGPRFLYLHGFASGPASTKGVALAERLAARGTALERLNLRVPSFEHLRLGEGVRVTRAALGGEEGRAVVIGSSLGALTAARTAERDPRVCGLFLLAPAFRLVARWRARIGEAAWSRWQETGWAEADDYAERRRSQIDFAFMEDAAVADGPGPFPDVRVPTVIVHGRGDEVVSIEESRRFAAGRRHVELLEVDDGHELVASLPFIGDALERFLGPYGG